MNNELKKIIVKLASLSQQDQRWVLNQLTLKQRELFTVYQGERLLEEARKFRCLKSTDFPPLPQQNNLIELWKTLRQEDPLYIAIILEQGQFSWQQTFLHTCMHQQQIIHYLNHRLSTLKTATKKTVFTQWQEKLTFNDLLETTHG